MGAEERRGKRGGEGGKGGGGEKELSIYLSSSLFFRISSKECILCTTGVACNK